MPTDPHAARSPDQPPRTGAERRLTARHDLRQWIELIALTDTRTPTGHVAAAAVNVSMTGLRVMLAKAPPVGTHMVVMLRSARTQECIIRHAVVRNLLDGQEDWSLVGVQFVAPPAELAKVSWEEWVRRAALTGGGESKLAG